MTRSELEQAIERGEWKLQLINASSPKGAGGVGIRQCHETWEREDAEKFVTAALDILLAEQKRGDGCTQEDAKKESNSMGLTPMWCSKCARSEKSDRYEPKGETNP